MELCYVANNPHNAMTMASIRLGYDITDYDKEGEIYYPVYQGKRIIVEDIGYGEIDKGITLLGSEYVMISMLQLYKNYEIEQIEFELFCDVLLKEGNNDLFRRYGINFLCYNEELGEKILAMKKEVKQYFDEVIMQYPPDNTIDLIHNNLILNNHYIDMVQGQNITWFIFNKINVEYLDMTVYELINNGGYMWYNFSSLFSDTNAYLEEKFTYAYELVTGKRDHTFNTYDGMRVSSKHEIDILPILSSLKDVMSQFTVIERTGILDAMRVKTYYKQRGYNSRIFKQDNALYYILIHGFVSINPSINNEEIDIVLRSNILSRLQVCQNDEDVVSLEKFNTMDILELLHIVPHKENGFTFCFSDEYDLDTNPYTRSNLNKDNIEKHYYDIFTL